MIITIRPGADPGRISKSLAAAGLWVARHQDATRVQFVLEPHSRRVSAETLRRIEGVESVLEQALAHPTLDASPGVVQVGDVSIGPGQAPVLLAGPCAVESEEVLDEIAASVKALGATFLRGGAYKPRTSPHSFQGHGAVALGWLRRAADAHGLKVVTEVTSAADAERVAAHAELLQIGARNMQNYDLLRAAGQTGRPVLLKRGLAATVDEWLLAAEHALVAGASGVIFCERGVRSFDPSTRFLLDLAAVSLLSVVHRRAVIVDPSHAVGRRDLVVPMGRAALAAGASGLLVDVHPQPGEALCDGPQALLPDELSLLRGALKRETNHGG